MAEELVEAFDTLGPAYMRLLGRGGRNGASWSQLRVLEALHCDGPLMLSHIGERLGVTRKPNWSDLFADYRRLDTEPTATLAAL